MPRTKQLDQLKHSGVLSHRTWFEYRCCTKRQQSDNGANLQSHRVAVRQVKKVIKETILGIPHLVMVDANSVDGIGNPHEMLKEAKSNLVINGIVFGQDQRDFQHAEAVKSHPCCTVGLVEMSSGRQWSTAIKHANVVQAQEPACKHISSLRIFAVHPPDE